MVIEQYFLEESEGVKPIPDGTDMIIIEKDHKEKPTTVEYLNTNGERFHKITKDQDEMNTIVNIIKDVERSTPNVFKKDDVEILKHYERDTPYDIAVQETQKRYS
jgi:hypothetical protein